MKRIALIIIAVICCLGTVQAQNSTERPDREQWMRDIREYKHEYLSRNLELKPAQKARFFETYDAMEDEINSVNAEVRQLEHRIREAEQAGQTVSDTEYEATSAVMLELKNKEYQIEKTYYEKLANILTPQQIFKLRGAERRFMRTMMDKHRQVRERN